jgi:putative CocE/NonD family hydrolase
VSKFNGNIGLVGISYPGFYAGASVINTHPAIKATSPQAPVADWFIGDDVHHNGALFLQETFDFCQGFDVPRGGKRPEFNRGTGSAYDFFLGVGALPNFDKNLLRGLIPYWNEDLMAHDTYDEYWIERSLPRNFKNVKCAVLTVGGFFDKEDMYGALNLYQYGEKQNKSPNFLVMGPWSHGGWAGGPGSSLGDIAFGMNTGEWYRENLEFRFFEKYLNNKGVPDVAEATIFSTGENKWYAFDKWPPSLKEKPMYFGPFKSLSWDYSGNESMDSYVNNPGSPTPYLWDFANSKRAPGDWLIYNQADFALRKDVLHYVSEPITEDLQVCGKITADMWIKTTGSDCDLVVKVIDVYPSDSTETSPRNTEVKMAGYQMMVRSDIFRAKFRKDFSKPIPIVPNQLTQVKFDLNETMHTFKKGHRIAIQVQSSWFPIADRNPNKFMNIHQATDADFQPATISLIYGTPKLSKLVFRQLANPVSPIAMPN